MKRLIIIFLVTWICCGLYAQTTDTMTKEHRPQIMIVKADSIYTDIYCINGKQVYHFDGSQLIGKTIKKYKVVSIKSRYGTKRLHVITTQEDNAPSIDSTDDVVIKLQDDPASKQPSSIGPTKIIWIIDGKQADETAVKQLPPSKIKSISIYKCGSERLRQRFGDRSGKNDYIEIELKK